jgi:diguanylate cyclase (GGDEF)-like protein
MKQRKIIILFSMMVFCCLLLSTIISIFSLHKISKEHTTELLQSLSNNVYRIMDDKLTETVNVSKAIANDTLLIDLLEQEEKTDQTQVNDRMAAYNSRLKESFSLMWVFIVSDESKAYYTNEGLYRTLDPDNNSDDAWYINFVQMDRAYNVTIGRDSDTPDVWTIFVDARIENEAGEFLGVCGVAVEVSDLEEILRSYEAEYDIDILFVDENGSVQIANGSVAGDGVQEFTLPEDTDGERVIVTKSGSRNNYTIIKYIESLQWYMVIRDFDPYNRTIDYVLITFNVICFVIFLLIALICLHAIIRRNQEMFAYSYTDGLTGLLNRRSFEDDISKLKKRPTLKHITFAALDVNSLKRMNDTHGHMAGDELIKAAAVIIRDTFAPYGKCYRTGGDEFLAILDKPVEDMAALLDEFEDTLSGWHGQYVTRISVSCGFVCADDYPGYSVEQLLAIADEEMYRKKKEYYSRAENDQRRSARR